MKHKQLPLFLVMLITLVLLSGVGEDGSITSAQAASNTTVPNQVVFLLKTSSDLATVAKAYNLLSTTDLLFPNTYVGSLSTGTNSQDVASAMSKDTRILYAQPNFIISYRESGVWFAFDSSSASSSNVTAPGHWAWQKTNLSKAQLTSKGKGVIVAVLDTGVDYNHPDLAAVTQKGISLYGDADGMDVNGHGTFVAGLIHQVAPAATILPVRILDASGNTTLDRVVVGMLKAAAAKANIINLSFSTSFNTSLLSPVVKYLALLNVVVVASVGNENSSALTYPAAIPGVMAVAATDATDNKATFSNYGSDVLVGAPGQNIYSTWKGGGYGWGSGTSFSAPIVGGAAALYLSINPTAKTSTVSTVISKAVQVYPTTCTLCTIAPNMGTGRLDFSKLFTVV